MGDVPYVHPSSLNPETVAFMTRCAFEARRSVGNQAVSDFLWGISTLASCNKEALAVALACGICLVYRPSLLYVTQYSVTRLRFRAM